MLTRSECLMSNKNVSNAKDRSLPGGKHKYLFSVREREDERCDKTQKEKERNVTKIRERVLMISD